MTGVSPLLAIIPVTMAYRYIDNVLEELDAPTEWFYDQKAGKLYFVSNGTAMPSSDMAFEAVTTKVLLNFTGTQEKPITDVSVRGLTIRDSAYTYVQRPPPCAAATHTHTQTHTHTRTHTHTNTCQAKSPIYCCRAAGFYSVCLFV